MNDAGVVSMFTDTANRRTPADSAMQHFVTGTPGLPDPPSLRKRGEPGPEEMAAAAERVRFSKTVRVKGVNVRTFNLSDKADATAYEELYKDLYAKVGLKQVLITDRDKKFVATPSGGCWLLHLEWLEYELEVIDHMKGDQGDVGRNTPVQYRPSDPR